MKTPGLIDLHLHLDGSLSVKSVKELAALQNIEIPETIFFSYKYNYSTFAYYHTC